MSSAEIYEVTWHSFLRNYFPSITKEEVLKYLQKRKLFSHFCHLHFQQLGKCKINIREEYETPFHHPISDIDRYLQCVLYGLTKRLRYRELEFDLYRFFTIWRMDWEGNCTELIDCVENFRLIIRKMQKLRDALILKFSDRIDGLERNVEYEVSMVAIEKTLSSFFSIITTIHWSDFRLFVNNAYPALMSNDAWVEFFLCNVPRSIPSRVMPESILLNRYRNIIHWHRKLSPKLMDLNEILSDLKISNREKIMSRYAALQNQWKQEDPEMQSRIRHLIQASKRDTEWMEVLLNRIEVKQLDYHVHKIVPGQMKSLHTDSSMPD